MQINAYGVVYLHHRERRRLVGGDNGGGSGGRPAVVCYKYFILYLHYIIDHTLSQFFYIHA